MAEYVALPHPPESVVTHHRGALDIEARVRHELEGLKHAQVLPELLEESGPRDVQERRNAGVAHEMRHVGVPRRVTHPSISTLVTVRERERLTCAPLHPQTQGYSERTPGRAYGSRRQGSCEMQPRAQDCSARRPFRTARAAACVRPLLAAGCDTP